jgi:hypothetical protein
MSDKPMMITKSTLETTTHNHTNHKTSTTTSTLPPSKQHLVLLRAVVCGAGVKVPLGQGGGEATQVLAGTGRQRELGGEHADLFGFEFKFGAKGRERGSAGERVEMDRPRRGL